MGVLALVAIHVFLPQRSGVLALTAVFEPYLVLSAVVAAPVALLARWRPATYLVAALVVVTVVRYVPAIVSMPGPDLTTQTVSVLAWNVLAGPEAAAGTLEGLGSVGAADLVGLVELQPASAEAVTNDPDLAASYPHRALMPDSSVYGVGLLSRFPILTQAWSHDPPYLRAEVETSDTPQPTVVYVVHPLPARIQTVVGLPVSLDTSRRDGQMAFIRALIEHDLAAQRHVIVLGDLNTTEREPAYDEFSEGFRDAHLDAGFGPGLTWRPSSLAGLPFGLLRIDYVLSYGFGATATSVTCIEASDHCLVRAELDVWELLDAGSIGAREHDRGVPAEVARP